MPGGAVQKRIRLTTLLDETWLVGDVVVVHMYYGDMENVKITTTTSVM
jgi:hypothetical protein